MEFSVAGEAFDVAEVGPEVTHLVIHQIGKRDLARLRGLDALPIRMLELRWLSAADLTAVPLPERLEELVLWQSAKLKSCAGIERAKGLTRLRWAENGVLQDGSALASLPDLRVLEIESGMGAAQKLCDLEFLRGLRLRALTINGIAPHNLDVAPLLALAEDTALMLNGRDWGEESLARIAAHFPAVHADLRQLEDYPADLGSRCGRCGGDKKMLRLRGRKFIWCPACEAKGLEKVLSAFDGRVEAARHGANPSVSDAQISQE